ncbi:unnamed protein product [Wuchereria bancrofti]|uniref:Uncharacterized protein n=1 Tax=Wuchereria bancrofti TaxID=6293 RepID=A0A3P7G2D2_WUCBA|nr:unnamed protein product [Wuchereria bancrofti]
MGYSDEEPQQLQVPTSSRIIPCIDSSSMESTGHVLLPSSNFISSTKFTHQQHLLDYSSTSSDVSFGILPINITVNLQGILSIASFRIHYIVGVSNYKIFLVLSVIRMRFLLYVSTVNISLDDFGMICLTFEFLLQLVMEWTFNLDKYSALRNCHCMPVSGKQPFVDVCAGAGTNKRLVRSEESLEISFFWWLDVDCLSLKSSASSILA